MLAGVMFMNNMYMVFEHLGLVLQLTLHLFEQAILQAVNLVKSPQLWRSLCLSAIRSRRHQVVHFCLTNMENAQCAQVARYTLLHSPDIHLLHL